MNGPRYELPNLEFFRIISVKGLSMEPKPPANITAFIISR